MSITNFDQLLEAGVHFGHLKRKWNPAMAPYIFMERRRGRQEKTEETVVSSGWRGKDRKGFLFVYLTPPSFGHLPIFCCGTRLGGEG